MLPCHRIVQCTVSPARYTPAALSVEITSGGGGLLGEAGRPDKAGGGQEAHSRAPSKQQNACHDLSPAVLSA